MKTFFILCLTATLFTSCKKDNPDSYDCGKIINMQVGPPDTPQGNGVNYYLTVQWSDGTQSNIVKKGLAPNQFHTGDRYCR